MSDFLRRMIEQAEAGWDWDAELVELVKVTPTEKNAVRNDRFDRMTWQGMLASVERLVDEVGRIEADHPQAGPAFEDLFNLLYQGDPRFTDPEKVLPEFLANVDLLRDLFATEEFSQLRGQTRYDDYAAVFAILTMEDDIRKAFERVAEKREAQQEAAQAHQDAQQGLQDALQQAQQAQQDGQGQDEAAAALQGAMDAARLAQQAAQQAAADHQQSAQDAVTGMATAAGRANGDLAQEAQMFAGYGTGDGELQRMDFNARRELAQRLKNSRLAKFAKMIGAFRDFADAERRRKVVHAPAEVHEYELGNDLTKLAPSEVQAVAIPELEEQFWLRYSRHELLLRKTRGHKKQGQGPIVVVCDESYSMASEDVDNEGNSREAWSKALALALCDQAKRAGRDFTYIGFASSGQQVVVDFPKGQTPIEKVIDFTEHFFAGGTHYERPLTMALERIIDAGKSGQPKADIVFVTDDECKVPAAFVDSFRAARESVEAKVYGIQIGRSSLDNALQSLCDRVISITKLAGGPEGVRDLFRQI